MSECNAYGGSCWEKKNVHNCGVTEVWAERSRAYGLGATGSDWHAEWPEGQSRDLAKGRLLLLLYIQKLSMKID